MCRLAFGLFCLAVVNSALGKETSVPANYELQHVFATVRSGRHTPTNYEHGYQLVKSPVQPTKLTQKGADTAFDMGRTLAEYYGTALGYGKQWKKDNYWAFGGNKYPWSQQAAFVAAAGLRNDEKDKDEKKWEAGIKQLTSLDEDLWKSLKKFIDPSQCPATFSKLKEIQGEFEDLLKRKRRTLDKVVKNIPDLASKMPSKLWVLSESLQTMKAYKSSDVPAWADETVLKDLDEIAKHFLFTLQKNQDLKKLIGGRIADDIIGDMEQLKKGEQQTGNPTGGKLSLFAPTQMLVASQAAAFNPDGTKFNGKAFDKDSYYPGQGAMHVLELLKPKTGNNWKVRVMYTNGQSKELKPVVLPGCQQDGLCDYDKFKSQVPTLNDNQLDQACKAK